MVQRACVKVERRETEYHEVERGVWQDYALLLNWFTVYGEIIIKYHGCVRVGRKSINSFKYEDDFVISADEASKLQIILEEVARDSNRKG